MKSCPAVDPLSGLVIVGSHDGHVYALNLEVRTIHAKPLIMRSRFFPFALQKQWIMSVFHFISYLFFLFIFLQRLKIVRRQFEMIISTISSSRFLSKHKQENIFFLSLDRHKFQIK